MLLFAFSPDVACAVAAQRAVRFCPIEVVMLKLTSRFEDPFDPSQSKRLFDSVVS
jgi:hypothetical protein